MEKTIRYVVLKVVSTIKVEENCVHDLKTLASDLVNEHIKVKSGAYENQAMGWVDTAEIVTTEEQVVAVFGDEVDE